MENPTIKIGVDLKGAVVTPGFYEVDENSRVNDLVVLAGGFFNANESCVNLAQHLFDGQSVMIPDSNTLCESSKLININSSNIDQLQLINGIGPGKAEAIIKYRELNGLFTKIDDIKNVSGIGPSTFEKIKEQITI